MTMNDRSDAIRNNFITFSCHCLTYRVENNQFLDWFIFIQCHSDVYINKIHTYIHARTRVYNMSLITYIYTLLYTVNTSTNLILPITITIVNTSVIVSTNLPHLIIVTMMDEVGYPDIIQRQCHISLTINGFWQRPYWRKWNFYLQIL